MQRLCNSQHVPNQVVPVGCHLDIQFTTAHYHKELIHDQLFLVDENKGHRRRPPSISKDDGCAREFKCSTFWCVNQCRSVSLWSRQKPSGSRARSTLLSLGSFLHQLLHVVSLGPLNTGLDSRLPGSAVFREAFPRVDINVCISHVMLACVFVAEGRTTSSSGTISELAIEQVFGDAAIIHTAHMAKPSKSQQGKDGR